MAKLKPKKKYKRNLFRNAARPPRITNATPAQGGTNSADKKQTTWGFDTLKTAGGALGAALTCALVAREEVIAPVAVTSIVTAAGTSMALFGRNETVRHVGAGIMSAAGAQLGLMLLDNHYDNLATQKAITQAKAEKAQAERLVQVEKALVDKALADKSKTKPANIEGLPPGALEAAYERARARLSMAQAAREMAA